jgi:hypothetical protein
LEDNELDKVEGKEEERGRTTISSVLKGENSLLGLSIDKQGVPSAEGTTARGREGRGERNKEERGQFGSLSLALPFFPQAAEAD